MTYSLISERKLRSGEILISPEQVFHFLKKRYLDRREQFFVLPLNGAHQVQSIQLVSIGTANKTLVHPREVFLHAIQEGAIAILLAHNHPSGQNLPSVEDKSVTNRLYEAGKLLDIPVLDHIIFSHTGYYSMMEHNDLREFSA